MNNRLTYIGLRLAAIGTVLGGVALVLSGLDDITDAWSRFCQNSGWCTIVSRDEPPVTTEVSLIGSDELRRIILDKNLIVVDMLEDSQGLTQAQQQYVNEHPERHFPVFFSDQEEDCLSLWSGAVGSCPSIYRLSVDGYTVTITVSLSDGLFSGHFSLSDNNRLIGAVNHRNIMGIPAELILF